MTDLGGGNMVLKATTTMPEGTEIDIYRMGGGEPQS